MIIRIIIVIIFSICLFLFCNNAFSIDKTLYEQAIEILQVKDTTDRDTIRFVVLSDTHLGNSLVNDKMFKFLMDSTIARLDTNKPDLIFICGDSYNDGGKMEEFYDYFKCDSNSQTGWMFDNQIPLFLVPGNHDFQNYKPNGDSLAVYYLYKDLINPFWDESFDSCGADKAWDYFVDFNDSTRFIITNNVYHPTYLDVAQEENQIFSLTDSSLLHIENLMSDDSVKNIFGFYHCPTFDIPYFRGKTEIRENDYQYRDLFINHGAKANFSGHVHKFMRYSEMEGFNEVTLGPSGGVNFFDFQSIPVENKLPNWVLLSVIHKDSDDEVNIEFQRINTDEPYTSIHEPSYDSWLPFSRYIENEPLPQEFIIGESPDTTVINIEQQNFKANDFLFSWFLEGNKRLTSAMKMNLYYDSSSVLNILEIPNNTHVIRGINGIMSNDQNPIPVFNSMAIQYEPTLILDTSSIGSFKTNPDDPLNPVFGFNFIHENADFTDSTILLDTTIANETVILENIWPATLNETIHNSSDADSLINGSRFFIDLHFKRHDNLDNVIDEGGGKYIIRLKIKYKQKDSTWKDIKFSRQPEYSFLNYDEKYSTLDGYRGKVRRMTEMMTEETLQLLYVDEMLPLNGEPIIISGYFVCDGADTTNPILNFSEDDSMNIRITYFNRTSIELDWVRLETPNGRRLVFGEYDSLIVASIQNDIDILESSQYGHKPFRYYLGDETEPCNWLSRRYFNKLVGNIGISGPLTKYDSLYNYYVGPSERWIDFGSPGPKTAMPYLYNIDPGYGHYNSLGLAPGFNGINPADSLISGYETFLINGVTIEYMDTTSDYDDYLSKLYNQDSLSSFLGFHESLIYNYFVKEPGLLYSDVNWWSQFSIGSDWVASDYQGTDFIEATNNNRPKTGEEIRALTMGNILKGSKALIFKRDMADGTFNELSTTSVKTGVMAYGRQDSLLTLLDNEIIYSDIVGSDFIENGDPNGFDNATYLSRATLASHMGVDENRIYIGQKSARVELKHIIDYCQNVSDELINLDLQAWYGKGYKTWYSQDRDYEAGDSILGKFLSLNISDWRIRPINRTKYMIGADMEPYYGAYYEPKDSLFFDVTLLKNDKDSLSDVFYIGIQNRRTDPLIYYQDSLNIFSVCDTCTGMKFFSIAEFEDSCSNGQYSTFWQNLWWKRLGCREFNVPFNFINSVDTDEYCLLHISEVGGNLYDSNQIDWYWRAPEFYDYKDTTIAQNGDFTVNMLPGEGKIFKVEVLHPGKIAGYLEHSNQSKLIAHAELDSYGNEKDSMRYYIVYHKLCDTCQTSKWGVYYRRSLIVDTHSDFENVVWENSEYLSESFDVPSCLDVSETGLKNYDCDYPSIIVRKNRSNDLVAHVVFSCRNKDRQTNPPDYIVESRFNVDSPQFRYTNAIGMYHYDAVNHKNWGNPVINASALGNYYAWSDSIKADRDNPNDFSGIAIGYRSLDNFSNDCLDSDSSLQWTYRNAQHPSMNVYSDLINGDSVCTLVWQEKVQSGDGPIYNYNNRIFLTQLNYDVINGLSFDMPNTSSKNQTKLNFNLDSTIVMFSKDVEGLESTFPVVLKRRTNLNYIFWDNTATTWNNHKLIHGRDIRINEDTYTPYNFNYICSYFQGSLFYELSQPNVAQGPLSETSFIGPLIQNNTNLVTLNLSANNSIYLLAKSHSFLTNTNNLMYNLSIYHISSGVQPHQALNYNYLPEIKSWHNRRVFNSLSGNPPDILASAKYYYRQNENDIICEGLVGFSKNTINYYVGKANLDGNSLAWNLPYDLIEDSVNGNYYEQINTDTIQTSTFNVAPMSTADIDFVLFGSSSSSITIGIEGHPSSTFISLPVPPLTPPDKGILLQYTLINMLDAEYKILFINHDSLAEYEEKIVIGGLPICDTIQAKFGENYGGRIIIDLETGQTRKLTEAGRMELKVFPNPAKDEVFVAVNYPVKYMLEHSDRINNAKIKFYSLTGEKLFEYLARPGETFKIPTREYTQGLYFIQAEENIDKWQLDYLAPAVERVFIER